MAENSQDSLWRWVLCLDTKRGFWPGFWVVVGVALFNACLQWWGAYDRFEWADLDRLLRSSTPQSTDTALVLITDRDYERQFDNRSPLSAHKLQILIVKLCKFKPKLIALDVLTSGWTEEEARDANVAINASCPLVWVRDAVEEQEQQSQFDDSRGRAPFRLGGAIGRDGPRAEVCTAIPILETDPDGVVRGYRTHAQARLTDDPNSPPAPYATSVWSIASPDPKQPRCGFERGQVNGSDSDHPFRIRFVTTESLVRFPVETILSAASNDTDDRFYEILGRLKGKRVIIGGAYRHARDQYATPVGYLYGAEILAHAVETELQGRINDNKWTKLGSYALDLAVALILFWGITHLQLRLPWAILVSSVAAVGAALFISWSLFNYFGFFIGVFASIAGVAIGAVADVIWEPVKQDFREFRAEYRKRRAALKVRQETSHGSHPTV